jgi:hypothetical protein
MILRAYRGRTLDGGPWPFGCYGKFQFSVLRHRNICGSTNLGLWARIAGTEVVNGSDPNVSCSRGLSCARLNYFTLACSSKVRYNERMIGADKSAVYCADDGDWIACMSEMRFNNRDRSACPTKSCMPSMCRRFATCKQIPKPFQGLFSYQVNHLRA